MNWEYDTVFEDTIVKFIKQCNIMGEKGWEMVNGFTDVDGNYLAVFKRWKRYGVDSWSSKKSDGF